MKMPGSPTAALADWMLMSVTTGAGTTLHAGGIVLEHPELAPGLPAVTSPVSHVSDDRTWLATANRIYALDKALKVPTEPICIGLVSILFEHHRALPQRTEFLKEDGSIYLSVSKLEMTRWIELERAKLRRAIDALVAIR